MKSFVKRFKYIQKKKKKKVDNQAEISRSVKYNSKASRFGVRLKFEPVERFFQSTSKMLRSVFELGVSSSTYFSIPTYLDFLGWRVHCRGVKRTSF